jgi:DNA-binding protein HU-beta
VNHDTTRQVGVSRRGVLRCGVAATAVLGFGLPAATGAATARENAELVEAVASKSGFSKADSARALEALVGATTRTLRHEGLVSWSRFGSFSISKRSARTGRSPQTGTEIQIAAKNAVTFNTGAELSKVVN